MDNRPHILVVDDDSEIRTLLAQYLEKNEYRTTTVADGAGMRKALSRSRPDLVVLDIMMPGVDGLTLCRDLRATSSLPVIMLTARGDEVDRIVGLELGADDYVPKPFNPRELLVRIKNVLRRNPHSLPDPLPSEVREYRFATWRLDTATRNLIDQKGVLVPLSGAEYRLLIIMLSRPNRVLSRAQLMDLARGYDGDPFDRSIDVRVSRLRQVLGDDAREPTIIKTVYGEGYVLGVAVHAE
jgi:two-component system OmpR family response regulator